MTCERMNESAPHPNTPQPMPYRRLIHQPKTIGKPSRKGNWMNTTRARYSQLIGAMVPVAAAAGAAPGTAVAAGAAPGTAVAAGEAGACDAVADPAPARPVSTNCAPEPELRYFTIAYGACCAYHASCAVDPTAILTFHVGNVPAGTVTVSAPVTLNNSGAAPPVVGMMSV